MRPTRTSWTGNYGAKLFLGLKLAVPASGELLCKTIEERGGIRGYVGNGQGHV